MAGGMLEAVGNTPIVGANVIAALRVAETMPPSGIVTTLAVDSGSKYLSTELYSRAS